MKAKNYHILKQPEYFVLLLAFLVVTAIFTISIITNRSISFLQHSNRNTGNAFLVKDKVQALLSDVLMMETLQRGIVMAQEQEDSTIKRIYMENVEQDLQDLKNLMDQQNMKEYDQLYFFVKRKVKFTKLVLDAYEKKGKEEAIGIVNTSIGDQLRDSVYTYAKQLESNYGKNVQTNLDANYLKSKRLQPITSSLSVISLIAIIGLSWLILYRINQKNQLIKSLRKAHRREIRAKKELQEAKKAAESSASIKQNFLANMSHEIRTPINAVLGFSNILQKTPLTSEQQKFVRLIQGSGSSLLAIVNDILDISKMEAGMVRIEKINFSLRGICDSVVTMFANQAKEKKLTLSLHINENCADAIIGDPLRLTQILTNLIANAVKFTTTGGVQVDVSLVEISADVCRMRFTVQDTGIGMTDQQLKKVFDRFDQGENDITRRFGGTGLGLAIVKNLVELQQGKISVESRKDVGSRFIFELPFEIQKETAIMDKKEPQVLTPFKTGMNLLVVEDNEVNQMLVEYILTEWDLKFEIASNGEEAIRLLRKKQFDLVLMDIQMPLMDGYTATTVIRKELNLSIPIIAMTAHALPGEQEKCISHGMDGYISKPLNEEDLRRLIQRFLKDEAAAEANENSNLIDPAFLQKKFSGNADFIKKILHKVLEQYSEELKALSKGYASRDPEAIAALAHKMRSTVTIVHKHSRQADWLNEVEMAAKSEPVKWKTIGELLDRLSLSGAQLEEEAVSLLDNLKMAI